MSLPLTEQINRIMEFLGAPNVQLPVAELVTALPEEFRKSEKTHFLYENNEICWVVEDDPENIEKGVVTDPGVVEQILPVLFNGLVTKARAMVLNNIADAEIQRACFPELLQEAPKDPSKNDQEK